MQTLIKNGDSVMFLKPPLGINNLVYKVVRTKHNLLPNQCVCLLSAPGEQFVAALDSEIALLN